MEYLKTRRYGIMISLVLVVLGAACGRQMIAGSPQKSVLREIQALGFSFELPAEWIEFWPEGVFVRTHPSQDPTFIIAAVIPGASAADVLSGLTVQNEGLELALEDDQIEAEVYPWELYSGRIRSGFLLLYAPAEDEMILDVALLEGDGAVQILSLGSRPEERDRLYTEVFIPAVESFRQATSMEGITFPAAPEPPARDYWPTEGWRVSSPAEQGLDAELLEEMVRLIEENGIMISDIVIVRNGYLVLEESFRRYLIPENLKSVTKSFTSALVGIAIQQGKIQGVDQPVVDLFPDREINTLDQKKMDLTVEDLLTMRAGIAWPAGPCAGAAGGICGDYTTQQMLADDDSIQFILDQPLEVEPGTVFEYSASASHLLSGIISETSGKSSLEFAREFLFEPLGIKNAYWKEDGENISLGYTDLELLPRDMAKFGFLYLNQGNWDDLQILSREYILKSHQPHAYAGARGIQTYYGYQWWVNPDLGFYDAAGHGGNYILIHPEYDLVVVFRGDLINPLGEGIWWEGTPEELFRTYILPAVQK